MVTEIIDLSNSPPSSPRSSNNAARILNFDSVSIGKNQFEQVPISLMACPNPNLYHTNQPQTTLWPVSGHINEPFQFATFQPSMQRVVTVLEPIPESNAYLFPNGARLKEPWTHREHELFLMGLIKYGKGRWSKIARHFVWNKTPQQVQSYAASFFRHLPSTYLHGFRRRKPTYPAANLMSRNNHFMVASASASYSMPMIVNQPQQTHLFFPEKAPFLLAPSYGKASSNTTTINYGFQMQTGGASTSVNDSANGEVDLELRMGRCH
ncbi:Transcription factor DIVARICATA [Spatholobus suberectus]|nr:Transcription factor DIVARICATA [Spatholobus suberectus]